MDSSDFSRQILFQPRFTFQFYASVRPPRVRTTTFVSCSRRVYCNTSGQYWTLSCLGDSSGITAYYTISVRRLKTLPGRKLFSLPSGFLQIPPRDGHPCLRLTVPTAKPVVDFHHQVVAHAGRTKTGGSGTGRSPLSFSPFCLFFTFRGNAQKKY